MNKEQVEKYKPLNEFIQTLIYFEGRLKGDYEYNVFKNEDKSVGEYDVSVRFNVKQDESLEILRYIVRPFSVKKNLVVSLSEIPNYLFAHTSAHTYVEREMEAAKESNVKEYNSFIEAVDCQKEAMKSIISKFKKGYEENSELDLEAAVDSLEKNAEINVKTDIINLAKYANILLLIEDKMASNVMDRPRYVREAFRELVKPSTQQFFPIERDANEYLMKLSSPTYESWATTKTIAMDLMRLYQGRNEVVKNEDVSC